ncbi:hypothetical protein LC1Hm_1869 [Halomicrobium sp. LC1Hm]|nr:hypothetical protein LC1Hm_1869 [Halomicrobium sp. LC1Hm]
MAWTIHFSSAELSNSQVGQKSNDFRRPVVGGGASALAAVQRESILVIDCD